MREKSALLVVGCVLALTSRQVRDDAQASRTTSPMVARAVAAMRQRGRQMVTLGAQPELSRDQPHQDGCPYQHSFEPPGSVG